MQTDLYLERDLAVLDIEFFILRVKERDVLGRAARSIAVRTESIELCEKHIQHITQRDVLEANTLSNSVVIRYIDP